MTYQPVFEVMVPFLVEKIYTDERTGAYQDVSVWRARLDSIPESVFMIGDVAFGAFTSSFPRNAVVLVKPLTILVKSSNRHLPTRKFGPTRAPGVDKTALFGEYMLLQALWP